MSLFHQFDRALVRSLRPFEPGCLLDRIEFAALGLDLAVDPRLLGAAVGFLGFPHALGKPFDVGERTRWRRLWAVSAWHFPPLWSEIRPISTSPERYVANRRSTQNQDHHDNDEDEGDEAPADEDSRCEQHALVIPSHWVSQTEASGLAPSRKSV